MTAENVPVVARDRPRVSVICVFYNADRFMREAIDSVLAQDFTDYELLLVDDGSTDGSTAYALALARSLPDQVRYLDHPGHANLGAHATRKLAFSQARGEFIAFIDSDDVWRPGKLARQVALMERHSDCAMICGHVNYWRSWAGGQDHVHRTSNAADEVLRPPTGLLRTYPVGPAPAAGPSEVLIRRSALERVRAFDNGVDGVFEDQVFLVRIFATSPVYVADVVWVDYRVHEANVTALTEGRGDTLREARRFYRWLEQFLRGERPAGYRRALARVMVERVLLANPMVWKVVRRMRVWWRGR